MENVKNTIQIIAEGQNVDMEKVKVLLSEAGLTIIEASACTDFKQYLESLPNENIPGFANECEEWIRSWGTGGGDSSTESCVADYCTSDNPRELAEETYDNIVDYCKNKYEAADLIELMINSSLDSLNEETIRRKEALAFFTGVDVKHIARNIGNLFLIYGHTNPQYYVLKDEEISDAANDFLDTLSSEEAEKLEGEPAVILLARYDSMDFVSKGYHIFRVI